ncbi:hypothetical protein GALMADRAFT_147012 [Galerina marginata CBS 339.88]|uniref:Uncharacterized protein n=1 Tax=Galerina marginata (strain CBS 339.88) TaxID=685588 RepID=A0A067SCN4_GALM3|nr:hypothetical protein GALMADRAFT_147012 [Galerina marginata CBS 339.88]
MNPEVQFTRAVKPKYEGTNGFTKDFTDPAEITDDNLQTALEVHRNFEYVLNYKQRAVPDFETMKAIVETDDPEKRLKALRQEHIDDLHTFYAVMSQEYKQDAKDAYLSKDESWFSDGPEMTEEETALLELYDNWFGEFKVDPTDPSKRFNLIQTHWQDQYEQIRYAYLSQLIPLEKAKRDFENLQEHIRIQREKQFPLSKADFESKAQDVRLRVAKFLTAEKPAQEKMLTTFGWAWRQVEPLMNIFKNDENFRSEIRAMIVRDGLQAATDPRKARTA